MKSGLYLSLLFLLLCGFSLQARSSESYEAEDQGSNFRQPAFIELIEKAECVSMLQATIAPSTVIENSLNELGALNDGKTKTASCLDEVLKNWHTEFAPIKEMKNTPIIPSELRARITALKEKLNCSADCPNGILSATEKKEIDKELKEQITQESIFSRIGTYMTDPFLEENHQLATMRAQTECQNKYPEGSVDYEYIKKMNGLKCGNKWLNAEEAKELSKKISAFSSEVQAKTEKDKAEAKEYSKLGSYNGYVSDFLYEKREELYPVLKKLACVIPYEPDSYGAQQWGTSYGAHCENRFLDRSERPVLRAQVAAIIGDPNEAFKITEKMFKDSSERQRNILKIAEAERLSPYKPRRLLAHFHAYLKKGGAAENLNGFCEKYEAEQRRDSELSEQVFPNYGDDKVRPHVFRTDTEWKYASEYGFTEGELGAVLAFMKSFYGTINPAIWKAGMEGKPLPEKLAIYRKVMDSGLEKLPSYTAAPVWRETNLPPDQEKQHTLGNVVSYDAFTSTSKDPNWTWGGKYKFLLYSAKGGKDVSDLNKAEQEVIFMRGTRFKVITRGEKGGVTSAVLAEVDEQGNIIADLSDITPMP
ncbi:MAG: hypothetical protein ACXVBE_01690 [Bdellovibrionota bacterium]